MAVDPSSVPSENLDKGPFKRVFHAPKLERKHSTGDLLSRLKTRKVLGVGETENGDVHRSKISQLLGHNEHLYVKLPRGLWTWQVVMATCITSEGMLLFLCPAQAAKLLFSSYSDAPLTAEATSIISSGRQCHGAAMLGFAFLLWKFLHSRDKAEARASIAAVGLYNFLCAGLVLATTVRASGLAGLSETTLIFPMVFRSITAAVSAIFYKWLGTSTSGMRKSSSFKDLHSSPIATTEKPATETLKKEL